MESTKKCPICAERIPADARVCPLCREVLEGPGRSWLLQYASDGVAPEAAAPAAPADVENAAAPLSQPQPVAEPAPQPTVEPTSDGSCEPAVVTAEEEYAPVEERPRRRYKAALIAVWVVVGLLAALFALLLIGVLTDDDDAPAKGAPVAAVAGEESAVAGEESAVADTCVMVGAYVVDVSDTNLRDAPRGNVAMTLSCQRAYTLTLTTPTNGWWRVVCVTDAECCDEIALRGSATDQYWIHHSVIGASTRNYGTEPLYLLAAPDAASQRLYLLPPEAEVGLLDLDDIWVKVITADGHVGWLPNDMLCDNPLSTCP